MLFAFAPSEMPVERSPLRGDKAGGVRKMAVALIVMHRRTAQRHCIACRNRVQRREHGNCAGTVGHIGQGEAVVLLRPRALANWAVLKQPREVFGGKERS